MKPSIVASTVALSAGLLYLTPAWSQQVKEMPDADTFLTLARELEFRAKPVVGGPVKVIYAPNFSVEVYFHTKMLELDPKPKPDSPPTQKPTVQDICYTENGKNPTTKYRKGVVYVPDS